MTDAGTLRWVQWALQINAPPFISPKQHSKPLGRSTPPSILYCHGPPLERRSVPEIPPGFENTQPLKREVPKIPQGLENTQPLRRTAPVIPPGFENTELARRIVLATAGRLDYVAPHLTASVDQPGWARRPQTSPVECLRGHPSVNRSRGRLSYDPVRDVYDNQPSAAHIYTATHCRATQNTGYWRPSRHMRDA